MGYDITLHWWAGDALRRGYSPYVVINAFTTQYPFCSGYMYWLPTAVMLEPFAWLHWRPQCQSSPDYLSPYSLTP